MKIVIDLQGAQTESRFRGIGRYSLCLAQAIARNRAEHEVIIILNGRFEDSIDSIRKSFKTLLPQQNIKVWYPLKTQKELSELLRESFILSLNPDVLLITSLFEGYADEATISVKKFDTTTKVVSILYDLIPLIYPQNYLLSEEMQTYYYEKIDHLKKVDFLLAISQNSANEALEHLNFQADKVTNISAAVSDIFKKTTIKNEDEQRLKARYSINKKFLMYAPGGFDERKNFELLIGAFGALPLSLKQDYQLVIVSKIQQEYKNHLLEVAKQKQLTDLVITGYVSDEELVSLYNLTELFIFPSKHEGFGLPLLEAMSCGAPVIGSNTTSIPEVIAYEAALFDPNSQDSLSSKIKEVLQDHTLKQKLKKHASLQAAKFSWDASATKAIKAIEQNISTQTHKQDKNTLQKQLLAQIKTYNIKDKTLLVQLAYAMDLNTQEDSKPTLFIDITVLKNQDYGTGIQRVVKSIVSEIYKTQMTHYEVNLVYLSDKDNYLTYTRALDYESKFTKVTSSQANYIIEPKNGDKFLGLDLTRTIVDAEQNKLFSRWRNHGVQINFVIYDILPILHPNWWPQGASKTHQEWLKTVLKVSHNLISISEAVSQDVQTWAKENNITQSLNYTSFNLGADIVNSLSSSGLEKDSDKVIQAIKSKMTFLMVGTLEPRKGHKQTLLAFEELWSSGVDANLVIVGKNGWMMEEFIKKLNAHKELDHRLFWLDSISDEYLQKVYEHSTCLIAASEGEGFGLPIIEAAQHKIPLIVRDIPVFREVAQAHAYYFQNKLSHSLLSENIKSWIKLYETKKHPKSSSINHLTWEQSTKELLSKLK